MIVVSIWQQVLGMDELEVNSNAVVRARSELDAAFAELEGRPGS